jgi:extracellular matrix regulatory protein A
MNAELVHVGFGNIIAINKVVAIAHPNSAPMKRMVQECKADGLVVDLTSGRKTKAVIIMDSGHLVLAALAPETIAGRATVGRGE